MNWLLRFIMGLPARSQDIKELKKNFPELIEYPRRIRELEYPFFIHPRVLDVYDFEKWIKEISSNEKTSLNLNNKCPFTSCPQNSQVSSNNTSESDLLQLMTIGTGATSPKKSFFDLVRTVYKGKSIIKKIILTDPYLMSDVGEDKVEGGFNNLIDYLNIIIREKELDFELQISPALKDSSNSENFKRLIKREFTNIKIKHFMTSYNFHDRLLITVDEKDNYKGLFGPSFNGLNSKSIVLFGELETKNTLDRIKKWFH